MPPSNSSNPSSLASDRHTLAEPSFYALLDRLRVQSDRTLRDHWAQCTACARWRLLGYDAAVAAAAADWTCADLDPPRTSCATPQTRAEVEGVRYAPRCAGEGGEDDAGEQVGRGVGGSRVEVRAVP